MTIPLPRVTSCRSERGTCFSDTASTFTPDELVLLVNHANPRGQKRTVPRALFTAVLDCYWSGHLA
jgi:hypothetical protein